MPSLHRRSRLASVVSVLLLTATLLACGNSSPTAPDDAIATVVALRAELNPGYSATMTVQAIANVTVELRRDGCGTVRFTDRRDGRTIHLGVLPFDQVASCPQPGRTGQRFDLPYAIIGPLASGHWVVESAGFQAGFDVP